MKILNDLINMVKYKEKEEYTFILPNADSKQDSTISSENTELEPLEKVSEKVFPSISVNLDYVNVKYNTLINSDIKIRKFFINIKNKQYSSFLLYIDGMIDTESINKFVIEPLMIKNRSNINSSNPDIISTAVTNNVIVRRMKKFNLADYISECLVPQNDVTVSNKFEDIFKQVNLGVSALFVDTIDTVFLIDAKGFDKRSITPPENEIIIRGSQEGFIENIRTNTSLLRRLVNNQNLVIEDMSVRNYHFNKSAGFAT